MINTELNKQVREQLGMVLKEENKFYVPQIEEFHVGFEYETSTYILNQTMETRPPVEWYKSKYKVNDNTFDLDMMEKFLKDDLMFRVKYLDKEDIEDLGFEEIELNLYKYKEKYDNYSDYYWHISKDNNTITIHNCKDYDDRVTIFRGNIKNKSELKTLLKQLNIQ